MSRPIRVHIGELVLHGFERRDRHAIAVAVREELARSLTNVAHRQSSLSIDRLDAGSVPVQPRAPRGIGTRVGRMLKGALRR